MISGVYAALSGLQAFSTRVAANANNVANMNTDGFKRDRVLLSTQTPQGVLARGGKEDAPGPAMAEMTEQGYALVEQANVDLSQDLPEMMANQHAYQANLKTITTFDQMMQGLLDIKA